MPHVLCLEGHHACNNSDVTVKVNQKLAIKVIYSSII